jgi:SAM-dependent methyltransferase
MYDPAYIRDFFDDYGEREWERLAADPAAKASFHLHRWYLRQHIRPGDHVLEAGAGPGRFTIELARLGARVTVGDISPQQIEMNRQRVAEAGCEDAVVERTVLDIVDLSRYQEAQFDAVVCYGGALSYVFERAGDALSELLRVTKPGGKVLLSVMSLLGSTRRFLPGILAIAQQHGVEVVQRVNATGDLDGTLAGTHKCHMYRWAELEALLRQHPCTLLGASAANFLALGNEEALREIEANSALWAAFLQWEVEFGQEPGARDGGTHIIAVVERMPFI